LRLWIEAPTGHTGFWAFTPLGGSAQNTVLHDPAHPSRLVVGQLAGESAQAPLPGCDTLRNQPCRADPAPNNWSAPGEELPGGGAGASALGSAGGLGPGGCVSGRAIRFVVHQNNGRVTRVTYRVSGGRPRTIRGRRIRSVQVVAPPGRRQFTVRIVAFTTKGKRVVSVRHFTRCAGKTRPRTRVRGRGRGRRA
jgi:hypothetical protein